MLVSSVEDVAPSRQSVSLTRGDWITIAVLALLIIVTRWPFRTEFLYNWDAANFALGMRDFNVTQHQPHPPGYPYVVLTGVLLQAIAGDANAALVIGRIIIQTAAVGVLYLFGRALYGRVAGVAAALLLAFSVTFWSHGEIALAYSELALFSALTAYLAYQSAFMGRNALMACAASYAVGAGFRPDLALFLAPLLVVAAWRQPAGRIVIAGVFAAGGVLLWLAPTALLSGGFGAYFEAFFAYFGRDVVDRYAPSVLGTEGLSTTVYDTASYIYFALYAEAALVVPGALLMAGQAWRLRGESLRKTAFLAGWCAPMLLFYLFVHIGNPGYVFTLLPALLLLGVGGWHELLRDRDDQSLIIAACCLALVLMTNVFLFILYDKPLTRSGILTTDRSNGARIAYLRTFNPNEVLVFTYDSYKQVQYYLPELTNSVWLNVVDRAPAEVHVPDGVRWAVFTDERVFLLMQGIRAEADLLGDGVSWAARLPVQPGQTITYNGTRIIMSGGG